MDTVSLLSQVVLLQSIAFMDAFPPFFYRPDITVQVDWVCNTRLLTAYSPVFLLKKKVIDFKGVMLCCICWICHNFQSEVCFSPMWGSERNKGWSDVTLTSNETGQERFIRQVWPLPSAAPGQWGWKVCAVALYHHAWLAVPKGEQSTSLGVRVTWNHRKQQAVSL